MSHPSCRPAIDNDVGRSSVAELRVGVPVGASFDDFVRQAAACDPYPYQRRLAEQGLPELLRVPTGCGKTLAASLPWLYRRRIHADAAVRASTPRWLVFVLPMRVLVEQTESVIRSYLDNLGLSAEVRLHTVMGGEGRIEGQWRRHPERDTIFVGTLDMLLSRALNRGYGESRFAWPIDFGLFNNGCQWVFDEIQLMGPALPTSRQLDGLRNALGTAMRCRSMWMSATVDEESLATVDKAKPSPDSVVELTDADRSGALAPRLDASRTVRRIPADAKRYAKDIAAELARSHEPGTRTIAVLNTVKAAREVAKNLDGATTADVVLLHSRYRPADRAAQVGRALADVDASGPGRIVVSTQVIEAGVDISAATMVTEAAPWPSIVQRAGRCNRDGAAVDANLIWIESPQPHPYHPEDVGASVAALAGLEGASVTSGDLGALAVPVKPVVHPVLRKRDLVGLFDTTPDLSGQDLDVGRFIREADDLDVQVAWREIDKEKEPDPDEPAPTKQERCPVPIGEMREVLKGSAHRTAWRFDPLKATWVRCWASDLRPGQVLLLRSADGGYDTSLGWMPESRQAVDSVASEERSAIADDREAVGDDLITYAPQRWVGLRDHLENVEKAVRELAVGFAADGISRGHLEAAIRAGGLHDIGKAHPVFQETMLKTVDESERDQWREGAPWAKPGGSKRRPHSRRYFRHELASALALLAQGSVALDGIAERDLAVYLVAAHHGRVRLAIRSLPGEATSNGEARVALGVQDDDELPEIKAPVGDVPRSTLDLSVMVLGDGADGQPSWMQRALQLRDRADLGPFRLAFLEALVRLADWRASAEEAVGTR